MHLPSLHDLPVDGDTGNHCLLTVLGRVISGDRSAAETNQFVMDLHTVLPITMMMSGAITDQLAADFDPNIWVEFEEFVSADTVHVLAKEDQDVKNKIKSPQDCIREQGNVCIFIHSVQQAKYFPLTPR